MHCGTDRRCGRARRPAAVLAGMSRTATSGPRLRRSQVITAPASAENQQLMRKSRRDKVSDQLVDYGKTADLGSNSLLRLVGMRCRTVLPWGAEGSKPSPAITSPGGAPARWNGSTA